jgi:hypothetical protein
MKLRCCVAVNRAAGVVFKFRGNPFARCLRWMIAADASLYVSFEFIEGDTNALLMRRAYSVVSAHQRG